MAHKTYLLRLSLSLLAIIACAQPCAGAKRYAGPDTENIDWVDDSNEIPVSIDSQPINTDGRCFATQIVPILDAAGAVEIFKDDLFCSTVPLNNRNPLDLPTLWSKLPPTNHWAFTAQLYYNQMGSELTALKLQDPALLSKFEHVVHKILTDMDVTQLFIHEMGIPESSVQNFDIRKLAGLFAGVSVQQRRIGTMFEIAENRENWTASIALPLQWTQRNFWLGSKEREALKQSGLVPAQPAGSIWDILAFARRYAISDAVGIGDTRFKMTYQLGESQGASVHVGGWLNIPTSVAFKRGMLGTNFSTPPDGQLDLCGLLNLANQPAAMKTEALRAGKQTGFAAVDRLAAIVLEDQFGSEKHWAVGLIAEPMIPLGDALKWHSRVSYEFVFAGDSRRYAVKSANATDFAARDFTSTDIDTAVANLQFLNKRLLEMCFPTATTVRVKPGNILIFMQEFIAKLGNWEFSLGTDYWLQAAEAPAARPAASQFKVIGSAKRVFNKESYDFNFGGGFDYSIKSTGIGKDFTVALSLGWNW